MADTITVDRAGSTVRTHPLYQLYAPIWRKLAHCHEGTGGFADGTYLVAHPREWQDYNVPTPKTPTKKLLARRAIARYENVAAKIIDAFTSALFRQPVSRVIGKDQDSTKAHPLFQWWQNVDGRGCNIDDYIRQGWPACGTFGHLVHLMDRPAGVAPETKADQQPPFLRTYVPLDLVDWLHDDRGQLTAVKLMEDEPRTSFEEAFRNTQQQRIVTAETWQIVSTSGTSTDPMPHQFGRLPVVIQFAKRRALSSVIGRSVLNDPQLYVDLYNLTSEIRELLRNQTFSILNIVLGTGENAQKVADAVAMLQQSGGTGTENVLFSGGETRYVTAETSNVEVYQKEREQLLRTIYRLASISWESDSKDAEAQGSLKLKREDMNQVLAAFADECEKAEYAFVELWFRAEYGERWQQELDAAKVTIRYPDTFDVTPFGELLEQAQAAVALEMPPTFMKELRKRLIDIFLPDLAPAAKSAIENELDEIAKQPPVTQIAQIAQRLQQIGARQLPTDAQVEGTAAA